MPAKSVLALVALAVALSPGAAQLTAGLGRVHLEPGDAHRAHTFLPITANRAVKALALQLDDDRALQFVQLALPIQVVLPLTERFFTGRVTLTLAGRSLTLSVDRSLLDAFRITCNESYMSDKTFQVETQVPDRVNWLVWRLVAWSQDNLASLPVVSLGVDFDGFVNDSFTGLDLLCRPQEAPSEEQPPPAVVKGNVHLVSSKGPVVIGHGDDYDTTAKYYARLQNSDRDVAERRCDSPCVPVLLSLPAPSKGFEYACRLNSGAEANEWWRCDHLGQQQSAGYSTGILTRIRIAVSSNGDPTSCLDIRHNGSPGLWYRYNVVTKTFEVFDSIGFQNVESAIRNAYRCVSTVDGAVIKEVYLEDGRQLVRSCRVFQDNDFRLNSEVVDLEATPVGNLTIECDVLGRLLDCNKTCSEKSSFIIEPTSLVPGWQRARLFKRVRFESAMVSKSKFVLTIAFDFSNATDYVVKLAELLGDYHVFLRFRNDVSYLASRFTFDTGRSDDVAFTLVTAKLLPGSRSTRLQAYQRKMMTANFGEQLDYASTTLAPLTHLDQMLVSYGSLIDQQIENLTNATEVVNVSSTTPSQIKYDSVSKNDNTTLSSAEVTNATRPVTVFPFNFHSSNFSIVDPLDGDSTVQVEPNETTATASPSPTSTTTTSTPLPSTSSTFSATLNLQHKLEREIDIDLREKPRELVGSAVLAVLNKREHQATPARPSRAVSLSPGWPCFLLPTAFSLLALPRRRG